MHPANISNTKNKEQLHKLIIEDIETQGVRMSESEARHLRMLINTQQTEAVIEWVADDMPSGWARDWEQALKGVNK